MAMETTPTKRQDMAHQDKPVRIGLLLIPDFSMMCTASLIDPFRSANRLTGTDHYQWDYLGINGEPVPASGGMMAPVSGGIEKARPYDYFFVVAGLQTAPPERSRINAFLRRQKPVSRVMGALCTGQFVLARAGMLDGYDFTLHWENTPAFVEEFPSLQVSPKLYVIDRDLWTGSGGLSSMDLALRIISDHHGQALARAVANTYQIDRMRDTAVEQKPSDQLETETLPEALQAALRLMDANLEEPMAAPDIADMVGMTTRSLERHFQRRFQTSPAAYYRRLRLERARQLLWYTNLPIVEIAVMTGFSSPSYLSRVYHGHFGVSPSQERRKGK